MSSGMPGVRSVVAMSGSSGHVTVVTNEGRYLVFGIDLEKGGEGRLLKVYEVGGAGEGLPGDNKGGGRLEGGAGGGKGSGSGGGGGGGDGSGNGNGNGNGGVGPDGAGEEYY